MAIRTTQELVRSIVKDHDPGISMVPFITEANVMTDWLSGCDTDSELTATELELIERNLAAHFYCLNDLQFSAKNTGKSGATFQGKTDMGLKATFYGQKALFLDTTGCLAKRDAEALGGGKRRVGIRYLGTDFKNLP